MVKMVSLSFLDQPQLTHQQCVFLWYMITV